MKRLRNFSLEQQRIMRKMQMASLNILYAVSMAYPHGRILRRRLRAADELVSLARQLRNSVAAQRREYLQK